MASTNFDQCFKLTLVHEGGYVDHPEDPGGATNLGVTIGTLSGYLGRPAAKAEVRALTRESVAPIYRAGFWDKVRGDLLPFGVDYTVYDFGVNSGPKRAIMALQRAVGVADDGRLGPITMEAVARTDPSAVVLAVCGDRMVFLRRLSTWPTFGRGWTTRVMDVQRRSLEMAAPKLGTAPTPAQVPRPVQPVPAPAPASLPANPEPVPPPSGGWFSGILARWNDRYPYKGS